MSYTVKNKNNLSVIREVLMGRLQDGRIRLLPLPALRREQPEKEFSSLKTEKYLNVKSKGPEADFIFLVGWGGKYTLPGQQQITASKQ